MLQWANRIDDVHRQRTLLKTAKGCGTYFLGVASMKINSRKARDTRRRRREPESRMRCEIRSTTLDGAEYGAISQKGRAEDLIDRLS